MKRKIETIIIPTKIKNIILSASKIANKYEKLTNRKLGITGEVGEILVCDKLKLKLVKNPQTAGFDAVDKKNKKYQIKSRRVNHNKGKVGKFSKHKFDYAILAVLDINYEIKKLYKVSYKKIIPIIENANQRSPSFSGFIEVADLVYEK